jgi:carbohydrate kinase (thermoresistant glucokinase family)
MSAAAPIASAAPLRLVVMGVSGCGKSTLAHALAGRLGLRMIDGDDLHLPGSVAKMRAGIALEDADRWPWLNRIGDHLANGGADARGCVVACSALRRSYRDRIRERAGDMCFLFLDGDFDLIQKRMRDRVGHYMQAGLLDSQFRTLEKPQADETDVITLPITAAVADLVDQAVAALHHHLAQHATP